MKRESGECINYIISYYQDEDLKERKQLAQSLRNITIMWLNSNQTKKDFYITVECSKKPCSYYLFLEKTNEADLNLNDQYSYYITKENNNMKFKLLKEHNSEVGEGSYVSIWVKGNKKIQTNLEDGEDQDPYKSYTHCSYYVIEYENYIKYNYSITINGEIGDLINVGLIFYYKCILKECFSDFRLENGEEITSYIEPSSLEDFKVSTQHEINIGYYYDINNKFISGSMIKALGHLSMKTKDENIFYTMQYILDTDYDGQGNNKYSPLLDGIYNIKQINKETTIGLIPMKPKDDFSFLTYEIFPIMGNISVSIYECDNYPLCHLNKIDKNKLKKIDNYQSYYYSYKKDDLKNISPISKNQKMLLITCEDGLKLKLIGQICSSIINMKTDNKIINNTEFNSALPPYLRFIREKNVDKYLIKATNNPIHLYIEKITGDISININQNNKTIEDNFYVIESDEDTVITITGNKNSIYSINDNYHNPKEFTFHVGFNYLIKLEKEQKIFLKSKEIDNIYNIYKSSDHNYEYFFKISPLNCDIKVDFLNILNKTTDSISLKKNSIYQDKFSLNDKFFTVSEINDDNCFLYISSYNINETTSSNNSYGFIFRNDTSQIIAFNNKNNDIYFSFPYTEFENDVKIQ